MNFSKLEVQYSLEGLERFHSQLEAYFQSSLKIALNNAKKAIFMAIENVNYRESLDTHSNEKRTIAALLDPISKNPISVEQVRVVNVHQDSTLGNHWREYGEIYGVVGNAHFTLEDIGSKERRNYRVKTGDTLYVPRGIALKVKAPAGSIVICCSEKNEREKGTHKYEVAD